jgi:hypothetical protein
MDSGLLVTEQTEISTRLIPAVVPAALIILIGIVGNILTIAFFSRKSARTVPVVLIKYLAVSDLVACIVSISVISEMVLNIRYDPNASAICKISHFMGNWTVGVSLAFLTVINIDRYRKICYPLGKQIPISALKYIGTCVVLFFMLSSARLLATFDIMEVNVTVTNSINMSETVTGFHCVASCGGDYVTLCLIFYIGEYFFNIVGIVAAVILYSRIIYKLFKRRNVMSRESSVEKHESRSENSVKDDSNLRTNDKDVQTSDIIAETKPGNSNKTFSIKSTCISNEQHKNRTSIQKASVGFDFCSVRLNPVEKNITLMMFATTVVYLVCFTPFFLIRTFSIFMLKADEENNYNA